MDALETKKTILVPVGMLVPTPWAGRPKFLDSASTQVCNIRTFLNVRISGSSFAQQLVRHDLHFSRVIIDYLMCHKLH